MSGRRILPRGDTYFSGTPEPGTLYQENANGLLVPVEKVGGGAIPEGYAVLMGPSGLWIASPLPDTGGDPGSESGTPGNLGPFHFVTEAGETYVIGTLPSTAAELTSVGRWRLNSAFATGVTAWAHVAVAGDPGNYVAIEASNNNGSSWVNTGISISLGSIGPKVHTATLPAGAISTNTIFRAMAGGGDDTTSPEIYNFAFALTVSEVPPPDIPGEFGFDALFFSDVDTWQDAARTTAAVANNDPIGGWTNQITGATVHGAQATSGSRTKLSTTELLNGLPTIRFDRTGGAKWVFFDNLTSGMTEGTAFVMVKVDDDGGVAQGLWNLGPGATDTWYPEGDGVIRDGCFTSPRKVVGDVPENLENWHLYTVRSKNGNWAAYLDGVKRFETATNTFQQGPTADGHLGLNSDGTGFFGYIACFGIRQAWLDDGGISVGESATGDLGDVVAAILGRYGMTPP